MNQKNTIKSLIPRRMLEYVPALIRDEWADRIVSRFAENNPELYSAMEQWRDIPEEELDTVQKEIIAATEQIHQEILDEN